MIVAPRKQAFVGLRDPMLDDDGPDVVPRKVQRCGAGRGHRDFSVSTEDGCPACRAELARAEARALLAALGRCA
jgi:hypothetical protein